MIGCGLWWVVVWGFIFCLRAFEAFGMKEGWLARRKRNLAVDLL